MAMTVPWRATSGDALLTVGLPLAALAVAVWDPARNGGPPLCPFRGVFGLACPGCGLTRAAGSLLRGRLDDALRLHPLIVLLVAQLVVLWVLTLLGRGVVRRAPQWLLPAVLGANAAVFVVTWALRWAGGSLAASA